MSQDIRCHSCSHALGKVEVSVRLAGLFKASLMGKVERGHAEEVRKRCESCGWVNVFHPVRANRVVEMKTNVAR